MYSAYYEYCEYISSVYYEYISNAQCILCILWINILLQVCVHLDGLNAKNTFHCWVYSV